MSRVAFMILAHNDSDHLNKLVNSLVGIGDIYIHVDLKANMNDFLFLRKIKEVIFLESRFDIGWAHLSMVEAQIQLIRNVIGTNFNYSHLIFLSGNCYPIKERNEIKRYFNDNNGSQLISFIDMRESPEHYLKKVKYKYFHLRPLEYIFRSNGFIFRGLKKIANSFRVKLNWKSDLIPYFGSQWIAITPQCASFIIDYIDNCPDFLTSLNNTFAPDEFFFHTIIGNSKYKETCFPGLVSFQGRGNFYLSNYHIIDEGLSKFYGLDDLELIKSSNKMFVRKVNTKYSSGLVNEIKYKFKL